MCHELQPKNIWIDELSKTSDIGMLIELKISVFALSIFSLVSHLKMKKLLTKSRYNYFSPIGEENF